MANSASYASSQPVPGAHLTGVRYQVTIPPTVADKLRRFGEGSLSGGIIKAAAKLKEKS